MLRSRAELGRFVMMIMGEDAAKSYSAQTLYDKENILTIKM